jgi:hypothetical protein
LPWVTKLSMGVSTGVEVEVFSQPVAEPMKSSTRVPVPDAFESVQAARSRRGAVLEKSASPAREFAPRGRAKSGIMMSTERSAPSLPPLLPHVAAQSAV